MALDKLVDSAQLDADLGDIADAIRAKGGTSAELSFPQGFVDAVGAIETGGTTDEAPFDDVNFYDYDGKIVYSYAKSDFLALQAMPENPSHPGLTAQGWNWTLAGAKNYVGKYGFLDIGQMYITDNGATRVKIRYQENSGLNFRVYWTQDKANGVTVDWGDGSATETKDAYGSGVQWLEHEYAEKGEYTIELMPDDDCTFWLGNSGNYAVWGVGNIYYKGANKIYEINFGKNVTQLGGGPVVGNCNALRKLTMPKSLTTINSPIRAGMYGGVVIIPYGATEITVGLFTGTGDNRCRCVCIPETLTNISSNSYHALVSAAARACLPDENETITASMFANCYSIQQVTIPSGITSIGQQAFNNCYSLTELTIPAGVQTIGAQAFQFLRAEKIVMLPTTPPTLANANAFSNLSGTTIYVPYSADHSVLDAYRTATNWSNYASIIMEMDK